MVQLLSKCESKVRILSVWFIEWQAHRDTKEPQEEIDFVALDNVFQASQWKELDRLIIHYYSLTAEKNWEDESGPVPDTASEKERRRATLRRLLPRTRRLGVLCYS